MAEKKKFLEVELPLIRKNIYLIASQKADLNDKIVKIDLTRYLKGKSLEMTFKVKADKDKAFGYPFASYLLGFFIRRMIRKGTDYVEASFEAECNNAKLRIKPYLITRKKVSRAVRNALRKKAIEYITDYIKNKHTDELFYSLIQNSFQKNISLKLKKVYPLALCEIRVLEVLSFKNGYESRPEEKEEVKEEKEEVIDQMKEIEEAQAAKEAKQESKAEEQAKE